MSALTRQGTAGGVIRIEGLVKRYGRQVAVDRLDLTVPEGAIFGLLGENGAGKTTTIRIMLGLARADAGRVEVLGLDPSTRGIDVRRSVGYVPEVPVLYDWMTVAEIGWFAAGFHPNATGGLTGFVERYTALARGFDLPAGKRIRQLSKGMRAKVSLALALAGDPGVLILDEPTSGLDLMVRRELLESIVDLAGGGRTVFLSSHQIGEVERVASHVALLHSGRLILAEPLDALKAQTFAVSLVFGGRDHPVGPPGSAPIELIDATDAPRQARWMVRAADRAAVEALRSLPSVEGLEIETPSLEEIYLAYMRSRRPSRPTSAGPGETPTLSVHVA